MTWIAFYVFGGLAVISALGVAYARSVVGAAVGLLFVLIGLAGVYLALEAQVLAAIQVFLAVAVAGAMIWLGLTLRAEGPGDRERVGKWRGIGACAVGALVSAGMLYVMVATPWAGLAGPAGVNGVLEGLGSGLMDPRGYLVVFELVGLLLLAVLIGVGHLVSPHWRGGTGVPRRPFDKR